jgi:glycine/D-amino acid oxidase-like deaminating enzyme
VSQRWDAVVVGGGFFGSYLAGHLAGHGDRVVVLEREPELMTRASLVNQARIHRGYHYPRSVLTGSRSALNFARFIDDFSCCVERRSSAYYAIARRQSNVNAAQFVRFCEIIRAPVKRAPAAIQKLFDANMIESVFEVEELTFDAIRLRAEMQRRLAARGVVVVTGATVERIDTAAAPVCRVVTSDGEVREARQALICCYAAINPLLERSGLGTVAMRHELVEMAVIEPPDELRQMGVTVMCGPFFSTLPFPTLGLHTLSHVRYTPHYAWSSEERLDPDDVRKRIERKTRFPEMIRDAARYLPAIRRARYVDSLWEVKAILPQSDLNDSRPILFAPHRENPDIVSIMGAKIDNVYDACAVLDARRERVAS